MNRCEALAERAAVVIVSTDVAALLPGVTDGGLKLHCRPAVRPEQDKVTALVKEAPTGATVKVEAADCPALMVCVAGVGPPRVKSWPVADTARGIASECSGEPATSCVVILML